MKLNLEKEFPLIPKEFWDRPKPKIKIQNILVGAGGAGQNFMLKMLCDSMDLPLDVERWPFNEYNIGLADGEKGAVFAWPTLPFASWFFNTDDKPVYADPLILSDERFLKDIEWDQPWLKSHITPIPLFEMYDIDYDNMIIVNQNTATWFYRVLATIKQRCQNSMNDGKQYRIKHLLEHYGIYVSRQLAKGIPFSKLDMTSLEEKMKKISMEPKFSKFFLNNSPLAWEAAFHADEGGLPPIEGAKKRVVETLFWAEMLEGKDRVDALNQAFMEDHPNAYFFDYEDFFFDLKFDHIPCFANTSKEEVRLYSLENIDMVRDFLNLVEGYEHLHKELDEWEERCWNA